MASNLEELVKGSVCFGYAYDGCCKECKVCQVSERCKQKCSANSGGTSVAKKDLPTPPVKDARVKPDTTPLADVEEVSNSDEAMAKSKAKESDKNATKAEKVVKEKKEVKYSDDMPVLKGMNVEVMENLLVERGGNLADFEKYKNNASIYKMRMTMFIKKTYEVK